MMKFLQKILAPKFVDFEMEDIERTLQSQVIQKKWLEKIVSKLHAINMELDGLLAKPDKDRIWENLAVERRTILRCLAMILEVRDEMESERLAQEAQDKLLKQYQGASAPWGLQ